MQRTCKRKFLNFNHRWLSYLIFTVYKFLPQMTGYLNFMVPGFNHGCLNFMVLGFYHKWLDILISQRQAHWYLVTQERNKPVTENFLHFLYKHLSKYWYGVRNQRKKERKETKLNSGEIRVNLLYATVFSGGAFFCERLRLKVWIKKCHFLDIGKYLIDFSISFHRNNSSYHETTVIRMWKEIVSIFFICERKMLHYVRH